MLYDTHAHVNFAAFKDDAEEVIKRAQQLGVWVNNVGTQIDTSRSAVEMAEWAEKLNSPGPSFEKEGGSAVSLPFQKGGLGRVYAIIGLHPVHTYQQMLDEEESHFLTRAEKFEHDLYYELGKNPKVVGIGECGLDYYRLPDNGDSEAVKALQKEAFVAQIRLAKELNKALVIHCRPSKDSQDAYEDILGILDEEGVSYSPTTPAANAATPPWQEGKAPQLSQDIRGASSPHRGEVSAKADGGVGVPLRFEIHSFTGSPEIVQEFVKRGAYVGFNGIITFDKTGVMQKNVEAVPLDRIVLETDAPYLTPIPHRGHRNEPSYVKFVAEKVAEIKKIPVNEVEEITFQNAKKLFNV